MSISQPQEQTLNPPIPSDADLLLRLRIALSIQRRAGWHLVRFTAQHGVVQLAGIVPAYYDRQLILALVRHVAGVRGIEDNLTIGDPSIRQQMIDDETIALPAGSASHPAPSQDPFQHVPILLRVSGRRSGRLTSERSVAPDTKIITAKFTNDYHTLSGAA